MIQFEKHILKNGLRVILHKDESTPVACINVLYDVGARDEHEDKTGFAHLFEHLMFGGSVNISDYDKPLQQVGGTSNAFTSNDITNYYETLPLENLETALWLESDRMLSLAFTPKSLEVQRSVVIEEFKQRYLNQPYGDVWLLLRPLAFKKHPYLWPTIGKEISHIENATMEDVKAFFKKHYCPQNAILCIAGNMEEKEALKLAEKWFSDIPAGEKYIRNLPKEPVQTEARELRVERDVPADALYKVWHMCPRTSPKYYATDLISDILSRGKSSRLYQILVKEKRMFTEANAFVMGDMDEGLFVFSGKLVNGVSADDANKEVERILYSFTNEEIPENELEKVKNVFESSKIFGDMSVLNKAMALCYGELTGNINLINEEPGNYRKITSAEIKKAAGEVLRPENCSTLFYLAKK
jgi:zinc protease